MRLPSLFRKPNYQRFKIEPRYYDPIKEEMDERADRIRRELRGNNDNASLSGRTSRISGSFAKTKSRAGSSATLTQLVIMVLLSAGIAGYLYVGNLALYIFATVSTLLVYLRFKQII